jgi:WD40 repeat protein/serine/threonine protein kinase/tetratricopeptide (TPR) repeat protein
MPGRGIITERVKGGMNDLDIKARPIFFEAIEQPSPEGLALFLEAACGRDQTLRARVEELLHAHDQAGNFLGGPSRRAGDTDDAAPERPGVSIGPYKLLQQIGEGGFGIVYMAEQDQPVRRRVALKIIRPGMDSAQVIARFEAERQALALMDHQNIAKVYDAGTTPTGRPYFVMELVHGVPMIKYCDANHLTVRERLELFVPVCQAIQHAHQKGIIHRDLKPSNVLVCLYDDRPVPKVIDFGVAKATEQRLTERTMFTQYGQIIGTFEYMSPEQAEMNQLGVDTRSDIYSLGVMLYELLTGSTPFQRLREAGLNEILRMIKEEEPPRPSTRLSSSQEAAKIASARRTEPVKLARVVRGELDWIVMKALEKDRTRRYETASGFARDIQRYLADEPVEACPPSAAYKLRKFARKNRRVLATACAFVLLLAAAALASTWQAVLATLATTRALQAQGLAEQAQGAAQAERQQAVTNLYHARVEEAAALRRARGLGYRAKVFDRLKEALQLDTPDKDTDQLRDEAVACLGDFVGLEPIILEDFLHSDGTPAGVQKIALTPDGAHIAIALDKDVHGDAAIEIRNVSTRAVRARFGEAAAGLGMDPDPARRWLVTATARGTIKVWPDYGTDGAPAMQTMEMGANFAGMSTNGRFAAALSKHKDLLVVWDVARQEIKARLKVPSAEFDGPFQVSDNGQWVAQAYGDGGKLYALVWNIPVPEPRKIVFAKTHQDTQVLSISADGRLLACQHGDDGLVLFDVPQGVPRPLIRSMGGQQLAACFSQDSRFLGCMGGLWDVSRHQEVAALEHPGAGNTYSATFSADGNTFATANRALHSVRIWKLAGTGEKLVLAGHDGLVADLAFSPDGKVLASASKDRKVKVWDVATGRLRRTLPGVESIFPSSIQSVDFSPDGRLLATGQFGLAAEPVQVWDLATGKAFVPPDDELGQRAYGVAFSPDGKILAACGDGLTLWRVAEAAKGAGGAPRLTFHRLVHLPGLRSLYVRISPNGKRLAWSDHDLLVCLWDLENGREIPFIGPLVPGWRNLAFFPDSDHLTFRNLKEIVETWDTRTTRWASSWGPGWGAAGSSDGRWLATSALWSPTGARLFLLPQERQSWTTAVSRDGQRLAAGMIDGELMIWNVPSIHDQLAGLGLAWREDALPSQQQEPEPFVATEPWQQRFQLMQYSTQARRLAWVGRVAEAEDAYRAALKLKGPFTNTVEVIGAVAVTHGYFGNFLEDQARYQEAETEFSEAIKLLPEHGSFWVQRGWAYAANGQWDRASADFVRSSLWVQRGWAHADSGEWDEASADFVRATQCKEADEEAWYSRAMLYLRDGNQGGYRQICADMLERFGEAAAWTCSLTRRYGADPARIVRLAETLLAKSSRDHWHVNQLGAALYRAGRFEEAVQRLTEANELTCHPYYTNRLHTWFFLAMAHHRLGHADEARRWLDKGIQGTEEALKSPAARVGKAENANGLIPPNWNRRLTLQLLRREAEQLIQCSN